MAKEKIRKKKKCMVAAILALTMIVNNWTGYFLNVNAQTDSANVKSLKSEEIKIEGIQEVCFYTGSEILFEELKLMDGTEELIEGTDYRVIYSNNIEITEEAKVEIEGIGKYIDSLEYKFRIIYHEETQNIKAKVSGKQLEGRISDEWYSENSIILTAPEGWNIRISENDAWSNQVEIKDLEEGQNSVVYYLKKDVPNEMEAFVSSAKSISAFVDTIAPTLSVTDDNEDVNGKTLYTNEMKDFQIICEDKENESGINKDSLEVLKKIEKKQPVKVLVKEDRITFDEEDKNEKITFQVNVKDISGRCAPTVSFTVVYDTENPEIINEGLFHKDLSKQFTKGTECAEEVLWINATDGTLYWKVSATDHLSGISKVELFREEQLLSEVKEDENGDYIVKITEDEFSGFYKMVATDLAGNSIECRQYIKVDRCPEKIADINVNGTHNGNYEDLWYNAETLKRDSQAPVLKQFDVTSNSEVPLVKEGDLEYAQNVKGDDLQITVIIDDNEKFFNKENIILESSSDGVSWNKIETNSECVSEGRNHTITYYFDGSQGKELTWQFRISYMNCANNKMILDKINPLKLEKISDGEYVSSQKVVIDDCMPKLKEIQFLQPIQMYADEETDENGKVVSMIKNNKTKLYYHTNATVRLVINEKYLKSDEVQIFLFQGDCGKDNWKKQDYQRNTTQFLVEDGIGFQFTLPSEDADYYFTISYIDRAGNPLTYASEIIDTQIGEAYTGAIDYYGTYSSPVFVRDTEKPEYKEAYNVDLQAYNSVSSIQTTLDVEERNIDMEHTIVKVTAKDINGKNIKVEGLKGFAYQPEIETYTATWEKLRSTSGVIFADQSKNNTQTLKLNFVTEANYTVSVDIVDKVKNAVTYKKSYCIDRTAPLITVVTKEGMRFANSVKVPCGLLDFTESDITYKVKNDGAFSQIINKVSFGYFSKEKIIVQVKVHDEIGGVENLVPVCISDTNEKIDYKLSTPMKVKDDKSVVKYEIELSGEFKGTVRMHGIDKAQNKAKDTGAIGMIVESEKQHKSHVQSSMKVLSEYSKTPNYYAGNVDVRFYSSDSGSGLWKIRYQAGTFEETVIYHSGEEICIEETKEHTIVARENNRNNIESVLEFLDNAGYIEKLEKEEIPIIHIDTIKPKIKVTYDQTEARNEQYFKTDRIATVAISERNFDPEDTKLEISGPDVKINKWIHEGAEGCRGSLNPSDTYHTDDCQWIATIHFFQDGDYTFTCSTTDLAGNQSVYEKIDGFVIDKTVPEIEVTYDNNHAENDCYYNEPRKTVIEIKEHNFNESDVKITVMDKSEDSELFVPQNYKWVSEEDVHRTTFSFDHDGEFSFKVEYTDLAGNIAEEYGADDFIIDLTLPEIQVMNLDDRSANNYIVAPVIYYSDKNYDPKGMRVEVVGYKNGPLKIEGYKSKKVNGIEYKINDLEHIREIDDMYTMNIIVQDLAGNLSEKVLQFSVNRFGSIYTYDEITEKLVGKKGSYYTKDAPMLVIHETNVDSLEFKEIVLNIDGKIKTLEENMDYTVSKSGNDESWKKYTYQIKKENFEAEGIYTLTIYSEDRAANVSDNYTKDKKIEFVVDKTAPSIIITGVENESLYREESRTATIHIEDNICVDHVEVVLNGKKENYNSMDIAQMNGKIPFEIDSANNWQNLQVWAFDRAGNVSKTEKLTFLITANLLIQFYRNKLIFYGSLSAITVGSGILATLFIKKKKTISS